MVFVKETEDLSLWIPFIKTISKNRISPYRAIKISVKNIIPGHHKVTMIVDSSIGKLQVATPITSFKLTNSRRG